MPPQNKSAKTSKTRTTSTTVSAGGAASSAPPQPQANEVPSRQTPQSMLWLQKRAIDTYVLVVKATQSAQKSPETVNESLFEVFESQVAILGTFVENLFVHFHKWVLLFADKRNHAKLLNPNGRKDSATYFRHIQEVLEEAKAKCSSFETEQRLWGLKALNEMEQSARMAVNHWTSLFPQDMPIDSAENVKKYMVNSLFSAKSTSLLEMLMNILTDPENVLTKKTRHTFVRAVYRGILSHTFYPENAGAYIKGSETIKKLVVMCSFAILEESPRLVPTFGEAENRELLEMQCIVAQWLNLTVLGLVLQSAHVSYLRQFTDLLLHVIKEMDMDEHWHRANVSAENRQGAFESRVYRLLLILKVYDRYFDWEIGYIEPNPAKPAFFLGQAIEQGFLNLLMQWLRLSIDHLSSEAVDRDLEIVRTNEAHSYAVESLGCFHPKNVYEFVHFVLNTSIITLADLNSTTRKPEWRLNIKPVLTQLLIQLMMDLHRLDEKYVRMVFMRLMLFLNDTDYEPTPVNKIAPKHYQVGGIESFESPIYVPLIRLARVSLCVLAADPSRVVVFHEPMVKLLTEFTTRGKNAAIIALCSPSGTTEEDKEEPEEEPPRTMTKVPSNGQAFDSLLKLVDADYRDIEQDRATRMSYFWLYQVWTASWRDALDKDSLKYTTLSSPSDMGKGPRCYVATKVGKALLQKPEMADGLIDFLSFHLVDKDVLDFKEEFFLPQLAQCPPLLQGICETAFIKESSTAMTLLKRVLDDEREKSGSAVARAFLSSDVCLKNLWKPFFDREGFKVLSDSSTTLLADTLDFVAMIAYAPLPLTENPATAGPTFGDEPCERVRAKDAPLKATRHERIVPKSGWLSLLSMLWNILKAWSREELGKGARLPISILKFFTKALRSSSNSLAKGGLVSLLAEAIGGVESLRTWEADTFGSMDVSLKKKKEIGECSRAAKELLEAFDYCSRRFHAQAELLSGC